MKNIHVNIVAVILLAIISTIPAMAAQSAESPAQATSVLERFRMYSGPRTPEAMRALFVEPVTTTIQQQPAIAMSDGAAIVKITMGVGTAGNKSPNVALKDAQLMSLKRIKADKWEIEAIPDAGTWSSALILLAGSESREVPLTVAPRLPDGTDLSEKGFIAFLGGNENTGQPLLDLNDDGRRDYLDDYIFTANCLVGPGTAAADPKAAPVTDSQPPEDDKQAETGGEGTVQPSEAQIVAPDQGLYGQPSPVIQGPSSVSIIKPNSGPTAQTADQNSSAAGAPAQIKLAPGVVPSSNVHNLNNRNQRARAWQRSNAPASNVPATAVPPAQ